MLNVFDKSVSIIIPTLREAQNIPALLAEMNKVHFPDLFEVILVDDNSQDGTEELVQILSTQYPWLRLIVRYEKKGLSHAVIEGFNVAKYANLIVLDADLSHPVDKIPEMLSSLNDVDFVIGSRYVQGGESDVAWPLFRKLLSYFAAKMTSLFIGFAIQDPLSGFIGLRKSTYLQANHLNPIGWKIGLELMVKCRCQKVREIPIHFANRANGASKLTLKVLVDYLYHLFNLAWFRYSFKRKSDDQIT